jgi:hypothetical protein
MIPLKGTVKMKRELMCILILLSGCAPNHEIERLICDAEKKIIEQERFGVQTDRQLEEIATIETRMAENQAKRERQEYVNLNPGISERLRTAILEEKIILGMNREQVKLSWGKPKDVNKTVGSWGIHEQWVIGGHYLYFENGILTSWQD